ncbi:DUF72 domain-containing protein [Flaviaesturariibacter flavus]|uniref:DUF72 domain-containing protein n=1 Tax=Flaviaesturariibacter flavus TaxID=2502780 RepID=A0A4R1BJH1_9BACT|nr:DUF72 domain-containing protein [Flaviaesturariibacter flavus]TCJ17444.1 DUF72 domain-containing protein [Flaviaesturariibacter flavus]
MSEEKGNTDLSAPFGGQGASLEWRIGCSGFHYDSWKEIFYPKGLAKSRWLEYYCGHFSTLEINNTFYRFPEPRTLERWYNIAPEGFTFTIKAPQDITHVQRFEGTEDLVELLYRTLSEGLQDKLGCVLFQLPPSQVYDEAFLDRVLGQLSTEYNNVIEFRHPSWWKPSVYDRLHSEGVTFSGSSYPGLSPDVISNAPLIYYRFHGVPKLYYSGYSEEFIGQIVNLVKTDPLARKAYLYFNNTAEAKAPVNAKQAQAMTR